MKNNNLNKMKKQLINGFVLGSCMMFYQASQAHAQEKEIIIGDPDRSNASSSQELVVDPKFSFDDFRMIDLVISVTDDQIKPVSGGMVKVYSEIEGEDGPTQSLLMIATANESGWIERKLQVPKGVKTLVFDYQYVGKPNMKTIKLDNSEEMFIKF